MTRGGAERRGAEIECPECDGAGYESVAAHARDAECYADRHTNCPVQEREDCSVCGGSGTVDAPPCERSEPPVTCTCPPMHTCPNHGLKQPKTERKRPWWSSVPYSSDKQKERTAFLAGIRAERIRVAQERRGAAYCERCDAITFDATDASEAEWIEAAMPSLDGHHTTKRSRGQGYRGQSNHGVDSPTNIICVCRRCHRDLEEGATG